MFTKTWFWIGMVLLAILAVFFNIHYADKAFNLLNLNISMSRKTAFTEADKLHQQLGIKLSDYRQAVAFTSDDEFQNYVELRAGGKKAFETILASGDFHPYFWQIRHFRQNEPRELNVYFAPDGQPLGFEEKVPEAEASPSLTRDAARTLADSLAIAKWHVPLFKYNLVEQAQEARPNGRIDHTFTYERSGLKYGEALIRLKLVVSGNRLTTLHEYAKIPEKFGKEYEEMRSYNTLLSGIASALMLLLYGIAMLVWLLLLLRQKQLIWKPAFILSLLIGIMMFLGQLNYLSFAWFGYNTSSSPASFLIQQLLGYLVEGLVLGALAFITLLVAEAVTRKAFPDQVQLWKSFSKDTAPTKGILGRVLGGYLIMPIELAYVICFYAYTQSHWGWWSPASSFSDPNILGSFSPFITAIGQAMQAGIWEESMFRALPLATMLIIGSKINKKWLFFGLGMIIQAFIFSSGHAGYAQQPFYSRMIELSVTSLIMGLIYFRFGLLPAIIWHFSFDALMMNISSLISTSADLIPDHIFFAILFLLPLLIVLWRKAQATQPFGLGRWLFRGWGEVPASSLNKAWVPAAVDASAAIPEPEADAGQPEPGLKSNKWQMATSVTTLSAIVVSLFLMLVMVAGMPDRSGLIKQKINGHHQSTMLVRPRLRITVKEATAIADNALHSYLGMDIPPAFRAYPESFASPRDQRYFMIKYNGYAAYKKLRNLYLVEDAFRINYKRFQGTLRERSESYFVNVSADGKVLSLHHILAEETGLPSLDETAARELVRAWLIAHNPALVPKLKEISAVPQKLPNRTDWTFTWEDKSDYLISQGQARLELKVAGDRVVEVSHYVFIPENTQRLLEKQEQLASPFKVVAFLLFVITLVGAAVFAIAKWSRGEFIPRAFIAVFALLLCMNALYALVSWRTIIGGFSTAEPFSNQLVVTIIGLVVKAVFFGGSLALICGWGLWWLKHRQVVSGGTYNSLFVILILAGGIPISSKLMIPSLLQLPDFSPAFTSSALAAILYTTLQKYFLYLGLMLFLMYLVDHFTHHGSKRKLLIPLIFLLYGLVAASVANMSYLASGFVLRTLLYGVIFGLGGWLTWQVQRALSTKLWLWCSLVLLLAAPIAGITMSAFVHAAWAYIFGYLGAVLLLLGLKWVAWDR